jgi:hypothetical protein
LFPSADAEVTLSFMYTRVLLPYRVTLVAHELSSRLNHTDDCVAVGVVVAVGVAVAVAVAVGFP